MSMIHLLILAVHLLATIAKLVRPGGVRVVVAESLLINKQLLISSRARRRAPNLNSIDRFVLGLGSLFVPASRIPKLAVILKPRTLLRFHEALKKRKYRWLFSSGGHRRPGPNGRPRNSSTRSSRPNAKAPGRLSAGGQQPRTPWGAPLSEVAGSTIGPTKCRTAARTFTAGAHNMDLLP